MVQLLQISVRGWSIPCNLCLQKFESYPLTFCMASSILMFANPSLPGDSKPRESPDEADIVWRLFIQILFN